MVKLSTNSFHNIAKRLVKTKQTREELILAFNEENTILEVSPVFDRLQRRGILLCSIGGRLFARPFLLAKLKPDPSGRIKPVICDFCFTRQPGSRIAFVTFNRVAGGGANSWLCCADLGCALNARGLTTAAQDSAKLLQENISTEQRIARLQKHMQRVIETLELKPIDISDV
jgi:hypothetical protein